MSKTDQKKEMKPSLTFSRRRFLKSVGGGVVVLFTTTPGFSLAEESHAASASGGEGFNAYLRVGDDGRVTCFTGKIEMGQGIITSLPQMLADELDVAVDMIDMVTGDTDRCPFDRGTWGSLTTRVFGPELRAAGAQARGILLGLAGEKLAVPVERLAVKDGVVFDHSNESRQVSYADLTKGQAIASEWKPAARPSGRGVGVACGIDADTVVATMAEVEVDRSSGQITVKRVVCAQDMGQVVNPAGATQQMEGCISMGLGYALTEAQRFRGGEILDLNFYNYELPLFTTQPKIEAILIDSTDPEPHGGGEPAIINMGAVIANALFNAVGVRFFELPMTPGRIKAALT